jgi:hypothetical protein
MENMITLFRALSAEILKTKRTLTLGLAFLAPLAIAFLEFVMVMQMGNRAMRPGATAWTSLVQNGLIIWGLLMLPLFVTLETGLLAALEHGNKTWKQLYALPLPRWAVYAAKQLVALGLIGLSMAVLMGLMLVVGRLLDVFQPTMGFDAPIPWLTLVEVFSLTYLAAWLIISLHLWVSAHWSSFVVAMGAGIVTTVAGVMVINSDWAKYYPWTMPGMVAIGFMEGDAIATELALGIVGGIVVALAAGREVTRRDVL